MASGYWDNVNVVCPFFKYESTPEVVCEGVTDGSDNRIHFSSGENKRKFKEKYCYKDYEHCPIAKTLYQKYDS